MLLNYVMQGRGRRLDRFKRAARLLVFCAFLTGVAEGRAQGVANVTVNVGHGLSSPSATALGVHTSVYDNQNGNSQLTSQLMRSGVTALRYPGGGFADVFHWSVSRPALGSGNGYGMTPFFGEAGNYGYMGPNTDFGSFVKLLTNSQCQAVITVDFGSGQKWSTAGHTNLTIPTTNAEPPEAAAWVAYANANTNIFGTANDVTLGMDSQGNDWKTAGFWAEVRAATPLATDDGYNFLRINRKAPVGIKFWEIGNETFGSAYYDTGNGNGYSVNYAVPYPSTSHTRFGNPLLSPTAYGKGVKSFSLLMKAVDPTIKIGAAVSTPPGDYSWDSFNGVHWTPLVLAQCATNIDFVIAHWYPFAGTLDSGEALLADVPGTLPVMVNGVSPHTGTSSGIRDWINDVRPDGTNVEIFITEFGFMGSLTNAINGAAIYGPVNTLFAADSYASWMELGVSNVDWLEMNKDTFLGDSNPLVPGAAYYAVQMNHDLATAGDTLVGTTSDTATLRAHAALQQGGKVSVMLLNDNRTNSLTVNVNIPNAGLSNSATQISFGTNNYSGGSTVPTSKPVTNSVVFARNSLSVTLLPYSMEVLTIPLLANTAPVLAAIGNRTVNAGQTVAFTATATDTDQPPQTLTFTLPAGVTNAAINAVNGAFAWRPLVAQADTTNTFTVQVADNGSPPLSATQSFTVTVNALVAAALSAPVITNNELTVQVNGQAGPDYVVEMSTNLVNWSAVFMTNSPVMPFVWTDTNVMSAAMRFYRIKAGP